MYSCSSICNLIFDIWFWCFKASWHEGGGGEVTSRYLDIGWGMVLREELKYVTKVNLHHNFPHHHLHHHHHHHHQLYQRGDGGCDDVNL